MKLDRVVLLASLLFFSILIVSPFLRVDRIQAVSPDYWPTLDWQLSTPESHGMNVTLLEEMEAYIDLWEWAEDITSLLVVHEGYLVY